MQLMNLNTKFLGKVFNYYEEIESTQTKVFELIKDNKITNGQLIMANIQTQGQGTHGRKWYTSPNNIAFSFYIEASCNIEKLEGLTLKIAQILVEVFKENYNIELNIKEPNDLIYNGKKLGGILTQSKVQAGIVKYIVIGIGINIEQMIFNNEIQEIATSIKKEFGIKIDRMKIIGEFCNKFEKYLIEKSVLEFQQNKKGKYQKMKIGFLFPGQGAQTIGMGKDLYENYEEAKNIYDKVKNITGIDIAKISFEGPEEELNKTQNTQLAILTQSLATLEVLKKHNIEAVSTCGLSLGEYTALIEDGVFDYETGVKLVQKRGEIMQNYTPNGNWKMAAILGLDSKLVEEACNKVQEGFVAPANYNTIGQTVVSGEEEAVIKAGEFAKELGAKKVSILNTAGPFHTEKLNICSEKLYEELKNISINSKDSKVIKNIDGENYTSKDDVANILSKHIMNPVKFTKCLETMYNNGVDTFIEIGPGKTLSSFVKRMNFEKEIKIININNAEALENCIKEVNVI